MEHENIRVAPKIRGIDPEAEEKVTELKEFVKEPKKQVDLDGDKVILGSELAALLHAGVGDKITLYSPGNVSQIFNELERLQKEGSKSDAAALKQMILPRELTVSGIFESGRYLYDSDFMLVPLYVAQEVYDLGGDIHGLAIRTTDRYRADAVKEEIQGYSNTPIRP